MRAFFSSSSSSLGSSLGFFAMLHRVVLKREVSHAHDREAHSIRNVLGFILLILNPQTSPALRAPLLILTRQDIQRSASALPLPIFRDVRIVRLLQKQVRLPIVLKREVNR